VTAWRSRHWVELTDASVCTADFVPLCVNVTKFENDTTAWMSSSKSSGETVPEIAAVEYRKYLAPIPPIGLLVCACVVTTLLSSRLTHAFCLCC
jgi:hypothetical protein